MENLSSALNEATQALTNSLASASTYRDRVEALEIKLEKLNRDYTQEITKLRDMVMSLQQQVNEGSKKYEKLKRQTLKLYQALKDANVSIPDIDADLMDTLDKIKPVR